MTSRFNLFIFIYLKFLASLEGARVNFFLCPPFCVFPLSNVQTESWYMVVLRPASATVSPAGLVVSEIKMKIHLKDAS